MRMVIVLRVGEGMGMDKCGKIPVLYTARQFLSGFAYNFPELQYPIAELLLKVGAYTNVAAFVVAVGRGRYGVICT